MQLRAAAEQLHGLPASAVTSRGNQQALMEFLREAGDALQEGDLSEARRALERAMGRTDGCARRGAPDGNGPGRDWITTCEAQEQVYTPLVAALEMIARSC